MRAKTRAMIGAAGVICAGAIIAGGTYYANRNNSSVSYDTWEDYGIQTADGTDVYTLLRNDLTDDDVESTNGDKVVYKNKAGKDWDIPNMKKLVSVSLMDGVYSISYWTDDGNQAWISYDKDGMVKTITYPDDNTMIKYNGKKHTVKEYEASLGG